MIVAGGRNRTCDLQRYLEAALISERHSSDYTNSHTEQKSLTH